MTVESARGKMGQPAKSFAADGIGGPLLKKREKWRTPVYRRGEVWKMWRTRHCLYCSRLAARGKIRCISVLPSDQPRQRVDRRRERSGKEAEQTSLVGRAAT